jgi:hypothetical protein
LSEARARAELRETVTEADAQDIIDIMQVTSVWHIIIFFCLLFINPPIFLFYSADLVAGINFSIHCD